MSGAKAAYLDLTLVISDKADSERDSVAKVWEDGGGSVLRVGRFWDPPPIDPAQVRLYGADTFCLILAQKWGLALTSPADDLLAGLGARWLGRSVLVKPLGGMGDQPFPCFVKPAVPKIFTAAVYQTHSALERACEGLEPETPVLVSEIVTFVAEARSFVLDGEVKTAAIYEGEGELSEAMAMLQAAASELSLPRTVVLDAGLIPDVGWVLVEANASWGAGLNGCDPKHAARCIAEATRRIEHES